MAINEADGDVNLLGGWGMTIHEADGGKTIYEVDGGWQYNIGPILFLITCNLWLLFNMIHNKLYFL